MLSPVLVAAPAELPVTLDEIKQDLKLVVGAGTYTAEDGFLQRALESAVAYLERVLARALVTQTWRIDRALWTYPLRLPVAPIKEVTVKYFDGDNVEQTVDAANYSAFEDEFGAYLELNSGASWPSTYSRADAVRVTYIAGYGDPEDVPAPIRQAISVMVGFMYRNREASIDEAAAAARGLWGIYRRWV